MKTPAIFLTLATCLLSGVFALGDELPPPEHPLDLRDGERVAFLGGTFIERMQQHGYLETLLSAAFPDRDIVFRNLGWSGDNVWGHSRAVFNAPDKGFERLMRDVKLADPTLIIVHYGENETYAGAQGLKQFREGMDRLLDDLHKATGARIVLLGPRQHEDLGPPLPSQYEYNERLETYISAIIGIARERGLPLVNLNDVLPVKDGEPLTNNCVHLTGAGYERLATNLLPLFRPNRDVDAAYLASPQGEKLRQAIIDKNELFFHRHRPQNETYLFLFRKHEQGNNAVEIPQFDPLIESKEQEIARLKQS